MGRDCDACGVVDQQGVPTTGTDRGTLAALSVLRLRGIMVMEEDQSQIEYPTVMVEHKGGIVLATRGQRIATRWVQGTPWSRRQPVVCAKKRLLAVWFDFSSDFGQLMWRLARVKQRKLQQWRVAVCGVVCE